MKKVSKKQLAEVAGKISTSVLLVQNCACGCSCH